MFEENALPTALPGLVDAELARRDLLECTKQLFQAYRPAETLHVCDYVKVMCEYLQRACEGEFPRLIINISPRHGKSMFTRIMMPAFRWLTAPNTRFLTTTYSEDLSLRDSRDLRRVIQSPQYQTILDNLAKLGRPKWEIRTDANKVNSWHNSLGGSMFSFQQPNGTTGEGADLIVIDDLMSVAIAASPVRRKAALDYYYNTLMSRKQFGGDNIKIIISQRLHEFDIVGSVLEHNTEGWEVLSLPLEYEPQARVHTTPGLGFKDWRTKEGEIMCEFNTPRKWVETQKKSIPDYEWSCQYRQDPIPKAGGILKKDWFKPLGADEMRMRQVVYKVASYDPAYSEKHKINNSFTARVSLAVIRETDPADRNVSVHKVVVLGGVWQRWGIEEFEKHLLDHADKTNPDCILIEAKASGPCIAQMIRKKKQNVVPFQPTGLGDKDERMASIADIVEAGHVYYLPWHKASNEAVNIICRFPHADNDDVADAFSQGMIHIRRRGLIKVETELNYEQFGNPAKPQVEGAYYG